MMVDPSKRRHPFESVYIEREDYKTVKVKLSACTMSKEESESTKHLEEKLLKREEDSKYSTVTALLKSV